MEKERGKDGKREKKRFSQGTKKSYENRNLREVHVDTPLLKEGNEGS